MAEMQTEDGASNQMSAMVGARIRELRLQRATSLGNLAVTTGLGKGTLSELERGQRNPTLDTLFAVATALSVTLGDLLIPGKTEPSSHARSAKAIGGSLDAELVARWEESGEVVEVYRMQISHGIRESSAHSPGVTETLTILSGEVEVGAESKTVVITEGESHAFPGDVKHLYCGIAEMSSAVLLMRYPQRCRDDR